jgi:hypothetical protein
MKSYLYKFIIWAIHKYFKNGLTPIYGTNKMANKIIAWEWRFYDLGYEKLKEWEATK